MGAVLTYPTTRRRPYRSPSLASLDAVPENVHDLWADQVRRTREADAELVTVQITRGMFNAIRHLLSVEEL